MPEYDVCFSFAGEDRAYVDAVARALTERGVKVFYDAYEEANLWGKNLYQHLDSVYHDQALFCVVFLSAAYSRKLWTSHELKSAQARAFSANREYILPARFDRTKIPGIHDTVGYIDLKKKTPQQLAELIERKIELARTGAALDEQRPSSSAKDPVEPSPFRFVVLAGTAVLLGMLFGAVTNAINGTVSPTYYRVVMGWDNVANVWLAGVMAGTQDGMVYGVILSLVYTVTVAKQTDFAAPLGFALKHFLGIVAGTFACWVAGGVLGCIATIANPERWSGSYKDLPTDTATLIAFGWVAGSIWAAIWGSFASLTIGLLIFRAHWKKRSLSVAV